MTLLREELYPIVEDESSTKVACKYKTVIRPSQRIISRLSTEYTYSGDFRCIEP